MQSSTFYAELYTIEDELNEVNQLLDPSEEGIYKNDELSTLCERIKVLHEKWTKGLKEKPNFLPEALIFNEINLNSPLINIDATFRIHLKSDINCKLVGEENELKSNDKNSLKSQENKLQVDISFSLNKTTTDIMMEGIKEFIKAPNLPNNLKSYFTHSDFTVSKYILRFKDINEYLAQDIPLLRYKHIHKLLLTRNRIDLEMLLNQQKKIKLESLTDLSRNMYISAYNLINNENDFIKHYSALKNKILALSVSFNAVLSHLRSMPPKSFSSTSLDTLVSVKELKLPPSSSESNIYEIPILADCKHSSVNISTNPSASPSANPSANLLTLDSPSTNAKVVPVESEKSNQTITLITEFTGTLQHIITIMKNFISSKFYFHYFRLLMCCIEKDIRIDIEQTICYIYEEMHSLLEIYCTAMRIDFTDLSNSMRQPYMDIVLTKSPDIVAISSDDSVCFKVKIFIAHNMLSNWCSKYKFFTIQAGVHYCYQLVASSATTKPQNLTKFYSSFVEFNDEIEFSLKVNQMRKEMGLLFTLMGHNDTISKPEEIAIAQTKVVDYSYKMFSGNLLLGLIPLEGIEKQRTVCLSQNFNKFKSSKSFLSIYIPHYNIGVIDSSPINNEAIKILEIDTRKDNSAVFNFTDKHLEEFVSYISQKLQRKQFCLFTNQEMEFLWKNRKSLCLISKQGLIPAIIYSSICLICNDQEIIDFLEFSKITLIEDSLILLGHMFCKPCIRKYAVKSISILSSDEFIEIVPTLMTSLVYELHHWSMLLCILIQRSWNRPQIAHIVFWNAKFLTEDPYAGERYNILMASLLVTLDSRIIRSFSMQLSLLKTLKIVARNVQLTSDGEKKLQILSQSMRLFSLRIRKAFNLPINYSFKVKGIDLKKCKVFSSASSPLLLSFINSKECGSNIQVIFKLGDQLRRDMITLALFRMMNSMWLKAGLDLKMLNYDVSPTGTLDGFIEVVPGVITLSAIHAMYGITGSFNQDSILNWLKSQNNNKSALTSAVKNFLLSLAAFCVATYILGICDRHDDNILLLRTGHLLHIDFNKYMGDAQTFLGFKRDRAPFVLTPDMVCVINEYVDKDQDGFQYFTDICCQAYKIIRRNSGMIINTISLLLSSNISINETVDYVFSTLKLDLSEHEAYLAFNKLIKKSLDTKFTQINFMVHSLAQMKSSMFRSTGTLGVNKLFPFCDSNEIYTFEERESITSVSVLGSMVGTLETGQKSTFLALSVFYLDQDVPKTIVRSVPEIISLSKMLNEKLSDFNESLTSLNAISLDSNGYIHNEYLASIYKTVNRYFKNIFMKNAEKSEILVTFLHSYARDSFQRASKMPRSSSSQTLVANRDENKTPQLKVSFARKNNIFSLLVTHSKNLNYLPIQPGSEIFIEIITIPSGIIKKSKTFTASANLSIMQLFEFAYKSLTEYDSKLEIAIKKKTFTKGSKRLAFSMLEINKLTINASNDEGSWISLLLD